MAELFGIAAGVAGFAALSIPLAEQAHKLSSLLLSIKDLPADLESMAIELEILTEALKLHNGTSAAAEKARVQLKNLSLLLQSLLDEAEKYVARAKHRYSWKAIRAVMKKDERDHISQHITRTLTLLQINNQMDFQ